MGTQTRNRAAWPPSGGGLALTGLVVCLLLLSGGLDGTKGGPARADAACGSPKVKPVVISNFSKVFANQYDKKMRVAVARGRSTAPQAACAPWPI